MGNWIANHYRKPKGWIGRYILNKMNTDHAPLADWAMSVVNWTGREHVLDVGCGGGANIKKMLRLCPDGRVYGLDYSAESVKKTKEVNKKDLGYRCKVRCGSVEAIPCKDGRFDRITAFETIYFWPDAEAGLKEIYRALKADGTILLACNMSNPDNDEYTGQVDGMRVYSPEQLEKMLTEAGFSDVTLFRKEGETICLTGRKGVCA